ncbi:MAG: glycerate kinase [Arcobacter sp.]|nr:glycerate kinase [Arcobacter sp.]
MKILIAPDSFKETLSAKEVMNTIEKGFLKAEPSLNITKVALSDGGEGSVDVLVDAKNGKIIKHEVNDALGRKINASYALINDNKTAVIEMATSCGLEHIQPKYRDPMISSTYGFGELLNHAFEMGVKDFILTLGGSATNDAGVGMLQALGVKFLDSNNKEIKKGAKYLKDIKTIDVSELKKFEDINIKVACDVKNPLCGENGASYTFAKQKGADQKMIKELDEILYSFALLCEKQFNKSTKNIEGTGAAGGLGFALITFLNAKLQSGIDLIIKEVDLENIVKDVDLVITGEGRMDSQTLQGKTAYGVAKLAKKYDKKVIAIAGCLDDGYEILLDNGFDAIFDCTPISSNFETIKKNSKKNLELCAYNVAKCLKIQM